jgi:hypothetical protein
MIGWLRKVLNGDRDNAGGTASGSGSASASPAAPRGRASSRNASEPFVVNVFDDTVVVHRADGAREELAWTALDSVILRVSREPAWAGKLWLILAGRKSEKGFEGGCVIPSDAINFDQVLARLQAMPGFDQRALDGAQRDLAAGKARRDTTAWRRKASAADLATSGDSED